MRAATKATVSPGSNRLSPRDPACGSLMVRSGSCQTAGHDHEMQIRENRPPVPPRPGADGVADCRAVPGAERSAGNWIHPGAAQIEMDAPNRHPDPVPYSDPPSRATVCCGRPARAGARPDHYRPARAQDWEQGLAHAPVSMRSRHRENLRGFSPDFRCPSRKCTGKRALGAAPRSSVRKEQLMISPDSSAD